VLVLSYFKAGRYDADVRDLGSCPGLAPIVLRELDRQPGITVRDSGFDGRSDVVVFDAVRDARTAAVDFDLTEDLFVEVGRTARAEGDTADRVAGWLWRPEPVQRALSVWPEQVRPLSGQMTFRADAPAPRTGCGARGRPAADRGQRDGAAGGGTKRRAARPVLRLGHDPW
jgi:hypothetical protein